MGLKHVPIHEWLELTGNGWVTIPDPMKHLGMVDLWGFIFHALTLEHLALEKNTLIALLF